MYGGGKSQRPRKTSTGKIDIAVASLTMSFRIVSFQI